MLKDFYNVSRMKDRRYFLKSAVTLFFLLTALFFLKDFSVVAEASSPIRLLTSDKGFNKNKMVHLDFSSTFCCRILSREYLATTGVGFDNTLSRGWATYQANKFATHLSTAPVQPGAPTGITGTRLILSQNTKKVGMYIQAGTPFYYSHSRPKKKITLRAYDADGNKIFEQMTDTCLGEASSCKPKFIGVETSAPVIRVLEIIINEPYYWSIDDLKWEPQSRGRF